LAAGAFSYGQGPKLLRVWNLETGERRDFTLPVPQPASPVSGSPSSGPTGYEGGIRSLAFVDEETLVTAGHGGLRRWNIETASQELLVASEPGNTMAMALSADGRTALTFEVSLGAYGEAGSCGRVAIHDLAAWTARPLQGYGQCGVSLALDPSGTVAATADREGGVRVGRVSGGEPHLLLGHDRWVRGVAISADLRWVATLGEDKTLRLWPMPDLSKPPLHTLPLDALLAKLKSLTNLRVVRDPASSTGWRAEIGPFPGWKEVPTW
jgi:WD40 repeat protein